MVGRYGARPLAYHMRPRHRITIWGDCAANENANSERCSLTAQSTAETPPFALDWVPLEAVPESLQGRQCLNCKGAYIDPLAQESTSTPLEKENIRALANSTQMQGNEIIMTG